jgi:membrane-associated protease RseP (regulator of RpoE activity)
MSILIVYLLLLVHIVLHEAGHAYAMRKAGVRAVEAGLGLAFPPQFSFATRKGFRWTLSVWLPRRVREAAC